MRWAALIGDQELKLLPNWQMKAAGTLLLQQQLSALRGVSIRCSTGQGQVLRYPEDEPIQAGSGSTLQSFLADVETAWAPVDVLMCAVDTVMCVLRGGIGRLLISPGFGPQDA